MLGRPCEPSPARRLVTLPAALLILLLTGASCVHLLQPQTYYLATARVARQRDEYLAKELMTGMPEALFKRWYTRGENWSDDLRPYILDQESRDGRTVYRLGSEGRAVADAYFRDGALEEVGEWILLQESVVSAWRYTSLKPRVMAKEDLARLETLDPASEPLRPEEIPERREVCRFESGGEVEAVVPLRVARPGRGSVPRLEIPIGPRRQSATGEDALTAGARLAVRHWGLLSGRLAVPGGGQEYQVDVDSVGRVLCPAGECAAVGTTAILARDLLVAEEEIPGGSEAIAVPSGQSRIPVWMKRLGTLSAGSEVRVAEWSPCGQMAGRVEIAGAAAKGLPASVRVPLAPPGLFKPLRESGGADRGGSAAQQ
ncbi:MAG TPA: hypothetical protein VFT43_04935 [Candidatus Polarisedimenticolia bacterium]|nr:hypothetical protein [Candidatus Polarisedimenticolia bacterium]